MGGGVSRRQAKNGVAGLKEGFVGAETNPKKGEWGQPREEASQM